MQSQRFLNAREKAKPEHRIFIKKNLAVVAQIYEILDRKGWTQKQLASELGKSESEISKWMSGTHNLTLQTISKIEAVLQDQVLITPRQTAVRTVKKVAGVKVETETYINGRHIEFEEKVSLIRTALQATEQRQVATANHEAKWATVEEHFQNRKSNKENAREDKEFCAA